MKAYNLKSNKRIQSRWKKSESVAEYPPKQFDISTIVARWNDWGDWSACTHMCDGGEKKRCAALLAQ